MSSARTGFLMLLLGLLACAQAGPVEQWQGVDYLQGRALVVLNDNASDVVPHVNEFGVVETGVAELDAILEEFECRSMARLVPDAILDRIPTASPEAYRTYVLVFRAEYPVLTLLENLLATAHVQYAEPDVLQRMFRTPNDSQFSSQWDKTIMGSPAVWDFTTGSPSIIVAGLDTGVDWRHPDLVNALWVNPGEDSDGDQEPWSFNDYPGDIDDLNGADDEGNGYVDDFLGWDFIQGIGGCFTGEDCDNVQDNDMFGLESHGTHVGGIMAASGNNSIGVAGHSWNGTLMALRCGYLASDGQGYMPQSATVPGTYYAVANNVDVINMSYGGAGFSNVAAQATVAAWQAGVILFGASGNDNVNSIHYPAGYTDVVAVNATSQNDGKAGFSNYGTWTDISAPGVSIPSTVINGGYQAWDGTSMASPNAAGAAALLWALFPDLSNSSLRDLMYTSAQNIDAQNPNYIGQLGAGRVDVENAAALLMPNMSVTSALLNDNGGDGDQRLESGETAQLALVITNQPNWAAASSVVVTVSSPDERVVVSNAVQQIAFLGPGQSENVTVTLTAGNIGDAFWLPVQVNITSGEGANLNVEYEIRVGRGRVLVVDDDGTGNFQRFLFNELEEFVAYPDLWSNSLDGTISTFELSHYQGVFWVCGNEAVNTLIQEERDAIAGYLNGGGKLFISGQGIRNDISGDAFFADYLHAAADGDANTGDRVVRGTAANSMFGDLNLLLQGGSCANNGQIGPDKITPTNGAVAAFEYTTVGGTGAVQYDGDYKLIYFGFSIEAACGLAGTTHFSEVVNRTLEWWGVPLAAEEITPVAVPTSIRLLGNYPNPFNPASDIRFELSTAALVTLNVYDVQGRLVNELVNEVMQPGAHSVRFDGSALASGVYFARLSSDHFAQTAKMVLLK